MLKKIILCFVGVIVFFIAANEAYWFSFRLVPQTEDKKMAAEQQDSDVVEVLRRNRAYTGPVRMIYRDKNFVPVPPMTDTMYLEWKDRIELARKEGRVKKSPSGVEHFDFGRMKGFLLPPEKAPTANGEPVFFGECTKWVQPQNQKIGWDCRVSYLFKEKLFIWYGEILWDEDEPEIMWDGEDALAVDTRMRKSVEEYLKEHPEFYYERLEKGE